MYVFNELNSIKPDLNAIHPDFTRDIEYTDGNIPDLFKEQKVKAYNHILEIEKIHSILSKFIQNTNPIESCNIAESFNHTYSNDIKIPQIFDKDFFYKAQRYLEQINHLKNDGVLDNYLFAKEVIRNNVNEFLRSNICKVDSTSGHIVSIEYNPVHLDNIQVANEIMSNNHPQKKYFEYLTLEEGKIAIIINIGTHFKNENMVPFMNECCLNDIIEKIYELKYFEWNNKA